MDMCWCRLDYRDAYVQLERQCNLLCANDRALCDAQRSVSHISPVRFLTTLRTHEKGLDHMTINHKKRPEKSKKNKLCFAVPSPRGNVDVLRRLPEGSFFHVSKNHVCNVHVVHVRCCFCYDL